MRSCIPLKLGTATTWETKDMSTTKAVLFDLDGVLINAADWHFEAFNRALTPYGILISKDDHRREFLGHSTSKKIEILIGRKLLLEKVRVSVMNSKREYFSQIMRSRCIPNCQRIDLLKELKSRGLKLGVVSNAHRKSVESMLKLAKLRDLLDIVVAGDDVVCPKPHSLIYRKAVHALGLTTGECVAVEDGDYGIASALAAGLRVLEVVHWQDVNLINLDYVCATPTSYQRRIVVASRNDGSGGRLAATTSLALDILR